MKRSLGVPLRERRDDKELKGGGEKVGREGVGGEGREEKSGCTRQQRDNKEMKGGGGEGGGRAVGQDQVGG